MENFITLKSGRLYPTFVLCAKLYSKKHKLLS